MLTPRRLGLLFIPLVFAEIMVATGPTRILRLAFARLGRMGYALFWASPRLFSYPQINNPNNSALLLTSPVRAIPCFPCLFVSIFSCHSLTRFVQSEGNGLESRPGEAQKSTCGGREIRSAYIQRIYPEKKRLGRLALKSYHPPWIAQHRRRRYLPHVPVPCRPLPRQSCRASCTASAKISSLRRRL